MSLCMTAVASGQRLSCWPNPVHTCLQWNMETLIALMASFARSSQGILAFLESGPAVSGTGTGLSRPRKYDAMQLKVSKLA